MEQDEAMELITLVKSGHALPEKVEDLVRLRTASSIMVNFHRDVLKKIKSGDLILAAEDKAARLADGKAIAEMLLAAEAKIGEISLSIPRGKTEPVRGGGGRVTGNLPAEIKKHEKLGLTESAMKTAQTIYKNPDAVKAIIKEAEDNEDLPTKTAVINKIKYDKEKERRLRAEKEGRNKKTEIEMRLDEQEYLLKLRSIVTSLPKQPPKDWGDKFLKEAKALALIIINRLEVFNE